MEEISNQTDQDSRVQADAGATQHLFARRLSGFFTPGQRLPPAETEHTAYRRRENGRTSGSNYGWEAPDRACSFRQAPLCAGADDRGEDVPEHLFDSAADAGRPDAMAIYITDDARTGPGQNTGGVPPGPLLLGADLLALLHPFWEGSAHRE